MGYRLVDDLTGKPLDRDHPPLELRLGMESWRLFLSDESKAELKKAIQPFVKDAEYVEATVRAARPRGVGKGGSAVDKHGFETGEVREWAIANKVKQDNGKPVGERGRISQSVYDAYRRDAQTSKAS